MADEPVVLSLATYDGVADAQFDVDAVKALHKELAEAAKECRRHGARGVPVVNPRTTFAP